MVEVGWPPSAGGFRTLNSSGATARSRLPLPPVAWWQCCWLCTRTGSLPPAMGFAAAHHDTRNPRCLKWAACVVRASLVANGF